MPENSELRTAQIVEALNTALSTVSNLVGMGKELYKFDVANMSTAAQVYSTNSELKRKMDKHRTELENELIDLLEAIIGAANNFSHYNINPSGLTITFDLSQFEDEDTKSQRKLREKDAGIISASEYRVEVYGESEDRDHFRALLFGRKINVIQCQNQKFIKRNGQTSLLLTL